MKNIRMLFIQMTSGANLQQNLDKVASELAQQAPGSVDMVIVPEMFALFGSKEQRALAEQETTFNGPVGSVIRQLAVEHGVWIVAGSVPAMASASNPMARCHVVDAEGELVASYDKIHLFDANVTDKQGAYRESDDYSAGSEVVCFDSPWGRLGLAICYDLRFPELFRQLAEQGAELVIVPAAFTYVTGKAHWEVLCRARAIENGLFIAAVNQAGQHDAKRQTWGHSMLVTPWGEFESLADSAGSKVFTADLSKIEQARTALPVHQHRKLL
ncbi:carbon-nitrogen hydrolase family protein [Reinekea marinisedimentorum]|uniref:Nitrilase n=1 Tax=Reinekea marinisedimentorum TaxID=230495 RepID=A0A4R3I7J9_9GAMM|nr:carbon-nitrogen hydrolase family protein [Reinekea marinisedimentorum]TCS40101.1 nitrilase [Reinekea marinisedimentorum]